MRHHDRNKKLGRVKRQRVALLRNLARSLVLHGAITTTNTKAKALRPFMERLVTTGKKQTLASRRLVVSKLGGAHVAANKLYETNIPRYTKRHGGYTRTIKLGIIGKRTGEMVKIRFVE